MKKILLFAAALVLFSCSKEDNAPKGKLLNHNVEKTVFYATIEDETAPGTGTKVYADEDLNLLWNEGDRISIFNRSTRNDQYVFTGEDGDNSGSFEEVSSNTSEDGTDLDNIYAVYPYSADNSINDVGSQITVNLPSEQTYREKSFGVGANTMVAVTENSFLGFKNACGFLRCRFYGNNVKVKSIILEGNNGEKIAGRAHITPTLGGSPSIAMDETAVTTITLNCPDFATLTIGEITDFIFVIPPTTFSKGFRICLVDDQGRFFEKSSTKSLTISRNKMETMGIMNVSPAFVQFEDDNFKAYCVENFDKDGDGEINYTEAQDVTRINVLTHNPQITSLKGVECFKNLTYLSCRGRGSRDNRGSLASLDISRNTKLDTLNCYYNNLTSLDVSNNKALRSLVCNNNKLTSLDVNECTALAELKCYNNQLTSLDVSQNTALTTLYCGPNQLTNLDISRNIALTDLRCANNQLTNLDISHNTALTYLNCDGNQFTSLVANGLTMLETLSFQGNHYLKSIDIGGCSALKTLLVATDITSLNANGCSSLQELSLSCPLTSLDVRGCTALTSLQCSNNHLTSLDVSECIALTSLQCYDSQLTSLDISKCISLTDLTAWPQSGTLATLVKKTGQSINYYVNGSSSTITPSDYGTEIIEVD